MRKTGIGWLPATFWTWLLAGCGGGGGAGSPIAAPAPLSVSVATAYAAFLATPRTINFTVSGDCSGSASWTTGSPGASTFEGSAALAVTQTRIRTLSGCTLASGQTVRTFYFDPGYAERGLAVQGGYYGVAAAPLSLGTVTQVVSASAGGLRVSVTLPGSGNVVTTITPASGSTPVMTTASVSQALGTLQLYIDSSKASPDGSLVETFGASVTQATSVTIGATVIKQVFDTSNALLETETETYAISPQGAMTLTAVDIQYAGGNGNGHLVFTAQ